MPVVPVMSDLGTWRWPRQERKSWPARWVYAFGWRQLSAWTPKIGKHAAHITVRVLPRHGWVLVGLTGGRDEDGELSVRVGLWPIEVEVVEVRFWR